MRPSLGVVEDEIVLKQMAIETPSAGCLLAGMKHILPTAIWELLVGEFNPGTGMAAVHLGSDHHKACLKLSAWLKQMPQNGFLCLRTSVSSMRRGCASALYATFGIFSTSHTAWPIK